MRQVPRHTGTRRKARIRSAGTQISPPRVRVRVAWFCAWGPTSPRRGFVETACARRLVRPA